MLPLLLLAVQVLLSLAMAEHVMVLAAWQLPEVLAC